MAANNVKQTASLFAPKTVGAILFLLLVFGIIGVFAGWWTQSQLNNAALWVVGGIWEGLKIAGSVIKFLIVAASNGGSAA